MRKKLRITKEYSVPEKGISLSPGNEFEKFSVSKDLFEDKVNYLIKIKNSPLLILLKSLGCFFFLKLPVPPYLKKKIIGFWRYLNKLLR